jgi:hypothetical protein
MLNTFTKLSHNPHLQHTSNTYSVSVKEEESQMKAILLASSLLFGGFFGTQQGVDVLRRQQEDPAMVEEHAPLREYAASILEGVDLETYTEEELEAFKIELQGLLIEKAAELGIELPEGFEFFQQSNNGLLMRELMTYARDLRADIDWASLTPEERVIANEEIQILVQERATELGITNPVMGGRGNKNIGRAPLARGAGGCVTTTPPVDSTTTIPTSAV